MSHTSNKICLNCHSINPSVAAVIYYISAPSDFGPCVIRQSKAASSAVIHCKGKARARQIAPALSSSHKDPTSSLANPIRGGNVLANVLPKEQDAGSQSRCVGTRPEMTVTGCIREQLHICTCLCAIIIHLVCVANGSGLWAVIDYALEKCFCLKLYR